MNRSLSILLIIFVLFLMACSTKRAVVDGGSIQAYMPTPNKGLGFFIDKDTVVNRVQMGIRTYDKETMHLSGLSNEANFLDRNSPQNNTAADIRYRLIRFPITLTVENFEKETHTCLNLALAWILILMSMLLLLICNDI